MRGCAPWNTAPTIYRSPQPTTRVEIALRDVANYQVNSVEDGLEIVVASTSVAFESELESQFKVFDLATYERRLTTFTNPKLVSADGNHLEDYFGAP